MSDLPQAETADPDGVQVALRAANTLWSRGDTTESLRWLRRAAESASDEGADIRSLQLAKAAAELRAKLYASPDSTPSLPNLAVDGAASVFPAGSEHVEAGFAASPASSSRPPASSTLAGDAARGSWPEDSAAPGSVRPVVTATQYPSHRPRPVMGLSSSTLGSALQREGGSYAAVPSWSADAERRGASSAPPPLPSAPVDEYEELEAEPDEEDVEPGVDHERSGIEPANSSWSTKPPPFPSSEAFVDEEVDAMRPEQPTVALPSPYEPDERFASSGGSPREVNGGGSIPARAGAASQASPWDAAARMPSWQPDGSWSHDAPGSWSHGEASGGESSSFEASPQKLTARVHHQAVRVSLTPDPHAPGQFVVRPLREGEKPLAGERVALLVALEPGQPLV